MAAGVVAGRSMKAGAFTPAIRVPRPAGHAPRMERSMKAGAFTPAIPLGHRCLPLLAGSRSMKAGAFHPRNPGHRRAPPTAGSATLNEGGGFHPRNPFRAMRATTGLASLNEGGGLSPPQSCLPPFACATPVDRSMKAGAFTPAIRSYGQHLPPCGHNRSMKAGAFTPAIPINVSVAGRNVSTLNEGGGFHPRNPGAAGSWHRRRR